MLEIDELYRATSKTYAARALHMKKDQIGAIRKRVRKGPSIEYSNIILRANLLAKFVEEDANGTIIKDADLIRWANEFNAQAGSVRFCSRSFVQRFKRENRIVSRNITHIVQVDKLKNHDQIVQSAQDFVDKINGRKFFNNFFDNFQIPLAFSN